MRNAAAGAGGAVPLGHSSTSTATFGSDNRKADSSDRRSLGESGETHDDESNGGSLKRSWGEERTPASDFQYHHLGHGYASTGAATASGVGPDGNVNEGYYSDKGWGEVHQHHHHHPHHQSDDHHHHRQVEADMLAGGDHPANCGQVGSVCGVSSGRDTSAMLVVVNGHPKSEL